MDNTRYEILVTIYNEWIVNPDGTTGDPIGEGNIYTLDVIDREFVTLDLSINEIQNISNRNSTFSKSIRVPDTPNNRRIFGFISELNYDSFLFNPNKRASCQILIDSLPVFNGTLQLVSIDQNYITNDVYYECVFFSSVVDFYKNMGEKYLTDLDGLSRYNHQYTLDNVTGSWTKPQSNGYYYPLIDYGRIFVTASTNEIPTGFDIYNTGGLSSSILGLSGSISLTQMYPAVYVKTIIDEIFLNTGYQYDSNFFNSDFFNNLIIPFSNKYIRNGDPISIVSDYLSGSTTQNSYKFLKQIIVPNPNPPGFPPFYTVDYYLLTYNIIHSYGSLNNYTIDASQVPTYPSATGTFSEINSPFINTKSKNIYINPSFRLSITGTGTGTNLIRYLVMGVGFPFSATLYFFFCSKKSGGSTKIIKYIPAYQTNLNYTYPTGDLNNWNTDGESRIYNWIDNPNNTGNTFNLAGNYEVEPNEECFVMIGVISSMGSALKYEFICNPNSYIKWYVSDVVSIGGTVDIPSNLPQNIKQKDFMTSLYKLFNLYVEPDKTLNNLLRIEPRDSYYKYDKETGDNVILNWTDKIDIEQNIEIKILSSTQNKTFKYTYKEDKDYFNSYYKSITNRIQGDSIKEIDNDFNSGDTKLEVIFGSTVLANIPGYSDFPVPNLSKQISETRNYPIGTTDVSIKILQKNGYGGLSYSHFGCVDIIGGETWKLGTYSSYTQSTTYSYYPYAGTYDDPYNPSIDINFDQQLVHFWYQPNIVSNNLFNTYYSNQFSEMSDINGRILTCEMYLTPTDIHKFYFNHIIYIELEGQGAYWRVNSIKNYDITGRSTCTVELIKALYPKPKLIDQPTTDNYYLSKVNSYICAGYPVSKNISTYESGSTAYPIPYNKISFGTYSLCTAATCSFSNMSSFSSNYTFIGYNGVYRTVLLNSPSSGIGTLLGSCSSC